MIIKKAEINDALIIVELEEKSFDSPWSLKHINDELLNENACIYLAQSDAVTYGFISMRINYDDIEIFRIAVLPEYRRTGIAGLLLAEAEVLCLKYNKKLIILEVNESNTAAINFYKKYSFTEYHTRKNYYNNNAALCMRKEII
jgi:[ribosomal protein S18]-alanine N-acetyltransferase